MAKLFRIFQHGSHGAVVVYGDTARVAIRMDEYINYRGFIDAVDSLGRIGGKTVYLIHFCNTVISNIVRKNWRG